MNVISLKPRGKIEGIGELHVLILAATVNQSSYSGVISRFNDLKKKIETYIIDFSKNIYNMEIRIEFLKRHRYEVKFKDGAELTEQIQNDIDKARLFFNEEAK